MKNCDCVKPKKAAAMEKKIPAAPKTPATMPFKCGGSAKKKK